MNDCTILIPTHNRPEYLNRILSYYSQHGQDFKIIIGDSSSEENKEKNKKIISSYPKLNINHLDKYPASLSPNKKFSDMADHVMGEFSVFCADDDFIIPKGIKEAILFLKKNPDFSVAHGEYLLFYKYKKNQIEVIPIYYNKSIESKDIITRLNQYSINYFPIFYAVHRANSLKKILKETTSYTNDNRFGELLPAMLDLVDGKIKKLDVLYSIREYLVSSSGATSRNLNDFKKEKTYNEKYSKFKECLASNISKKSNLDIEKSKKIIDNLILNYAENNGKMETFKRIFDRLNLPFWIDSGFRKIYREHILKRRAKRDPIWTKINDPNSKYHEDFINIKKAILNQE